jgi:hypothetical protein
MRENDVVILDDALFCGLPHLEHISTGSKPYIRGVFFWEIKRFIYGDNFLKIFHIKYETKRVELENMR